MDVQTLTLADIGPAICGEVNNFLLGDLPNSLVNGFDIVRDARNLLDGSTVSDDHVFHIIIPQFEIDKFAEEPWADDLELSSKNAASVDVAKANVSDLG